MNPIVWLSTICLMYCLSEPKYLDGSIVESESVSSIVDFIDANIKFLRFAKTKNITVILGNTGSADKTLLDLFMTNDGELNVVQDSVGKYRTADKFGLIKKYSTSIIPELIPNRRSGADYYIYPHLNNTSDAKNEFSTMHLFQRVLNFAEAVKFVFTVDYWVCNGGKTPSEEQKNHVRQLVTNATRLIKDVSKFRDSMALVILNVKNELTPSKLNAELLFELLYIFHSIRTEVRNDPVKRTFLDALLKQDEISYVHATLIRQPNQTGFVKDIPWMESERMYTSMIVHNNIQPVNITSSDFEYVLTNDAIKIIPELIHEVYDRLMVGVTKIAYEIQSKFISQESRITDISQLHENMNLAYKIVSEINSNEPNLFAKQLVGAIEVLDVEISIENMEIFLNHIELFGFLDTKKPVYRKSIPITFALNVVTEYLRNATLWYNFNINLYDTLSQWDVQKDTTRYQAIVGKLKDELTIPENGTRNLDTTSIKQFVEEVGGSLDPELMNMPLNSFKGIKFIALLDEAISGVLDSSCSPAKFTVKGYNVKISDVISMPCMRNAKIIEIFAINILFLDADINKSGAEARLFLAAQIWLIIGNRRIILSGPSGRVHNPQTAADGQSELDMHGRDGLPGNPGVSSGHITCFGEAFVNAEKLQIHLDGGKGGPGQHGGKGS